MSVTDVRVFVQQLNDRGLGMRMVQFVHAVLRNALESAVRDEVVPRNVARLIQVKTPTYNVGRGLTVAQARALLQVARSERLECLNVLAVYLGPTAMARTTCSTDSLFTAVIEASIPRSRCQAAAMWNPPPRSRGICRCLGQNASLRARTATERPDRGSVPMRGQ